MTEPVNVLDQLDGDFSIYALKVVSALVEESVMIGFWRGQPKGSQWLAVIGIDEDGFVAMKGSTPEQALVRAMDKHQRQHQK